MFHSCETGCNSLLTIHGNCHIERLSSSYVNAGNKCTLACFSQTHFSMVSELEAKGKVICYVYTYLRKKLVNSGITISSFKPSVNGNWIWLNYDHTEQQLYAKRGSLTKISSLPHQPNVITIPVCASILYNDNSVGS